MIEDSQARPKSNLRRLTGIVLVALVLRLIVVGFLYQERLNPDRDHWRFAGETGRIARSLVQGKGFSSPMFADTGPTAWMTPIYPALLAATFRLFGVYTKASAIFMLSLNSLFSALACLPLYLMARKSFGEITAVRTAWAWAFFPYGIYFPADFIWPTALTTLLLPLAFLAGLELEDSRRLAHWFGFGLLSGVAALNDPVVVSVLVPLGLWMCFRTRRGGNWPRLAVGATLGFIVVVSPWFLRNYETFHKLIPFRDNLGLELYVGNNGDSSHFISEYLHPTHNEKEWQEYVQLGELRYMQRKQDQAMDFISGHKEFFLWISLRRALYMWTNFWSLNRNYLQQEPFDPPAIVLCVTLTLLALWGLWSGWRAQGAAVVPYVIALFFFPVVYYVTHLEDYYRRPADPFFVVLAVYAVTTHLERRKRRSAADKPEGLPHVQTAS